MTIIDGIGLSGFRSFGPNMEYVGPFGKMNIIIGSNNSGKSNILLYISQYYNDTILKLQRNKPISFPELNRNVDTNEDELKISIGIQMGGGYHEEILNSIKEKNPPQFDAIESAIDWILNSEPLSNSTDLAWFTYEVASGRSDLSSTLTRSFANVGLPNNMNWSKLCSLLSLEAGGNRQARVEGVLNPYPAR